MFFANITAVSVLLFLFLLIAVAFFYVSKAKKKKEKAREKEKMLRRQEEKQEEFLSTWKSLVEVFFYGLGDKLRSYEMVGTFEIKRVFFGHGGWMTGFNGWVTRTIWDEGLRGKTWNRYPTDYIYKLTARFVADELQITVVADRFGVSKEQKITLDWVEKPLFLFGVPLQDCMAKYPLLREAEEINPSHVKVKTGRSVSSLLEKQLYFAAEHKIRDVFRQVFGPGILSDLEPALFTEKWELFIEQVSRRGEELRVFELKAVHEICTIHLYYSHVQHELMGTMDVRVKFGDDSFEFQQYLEDASLLLAHFLQPPMMDLKARKSVIRPITTLLESPLGQE